MTLAELISNIVSSSGFTASVIAVLVPLLSNVLASRSIEAYKAGHSRELETWKSSLEIARGQKIRISDAQFELYIDVWSRLQDVKSTGDLLWKRATKEHIGDLIKSLDAVRIAVNRGRLILQESHYQQLQEVFRVFES